MLVVVFVGFLYVVEWLVNDKYLVGRITFYFFNCVFCCQSDYNIKILFVYFIEGDQILFRAYGALFVAVYSYGGYLVVSE